MAQNTIVASQAALTLAESFTALGSIVNLAPALWGAVKHPNSEHRLSIEMTTPEAVVALAADLNLPTRTYGGWPGHKFTSTDIVAGHVTLHLFAEHDPHKELRRPVDATEAIEGQAA